MPGHAFLRCAGAEVRDPARIPRILAKVAKLWTACPDWRLGQLLGNVSLVTTDPYCQEDDMLEVALDREIEERKL